MSPEELASYIPLKCPLNFLFGIECPTCGLGRSICALLLGDIQKSFKFHPLGPVLFFGLLGLSLNFALGWTQKFFKLRLKI